MKTKSGWPELMKTLLGCVFVFALSRIAFAQQPQPGAASMDAWRARLNGQMDQYLSELETANRDAAPLIQVDRRGETDLPPASTNMKLEPRRPNDPLAQTVDGVLRRQGLPAQLLSVVAVESAFRPWALSPKGALGLWQLMPETARRYGLVVSGAQDERRDPLKSTVAAANYLRDLYGQFGNWPLALAAYNAGEKRVQEAVDRYGTRDFFALSVRLALPDETRRYVPAVLLKAGSNVPEPTGIGEGNQLPRPFMPATVVFASAVASPSEAPLSAPRSASTPLPSLSN